MGTNTKILYGSVIAVLCTLMLLFFSMSRNSQLKLDAEQNGQLAQQKGKVSEVLQQQLEATESEVESIKTEITVIPKLQAVIDAGKKEKQLYLDELEGLQSELKDQKKIANGHLAEITSLHEKYIETEQEKASTAIQLAEMSEQYASLRKAIDKRDEQISQLKQSIEQKSRDIEFHIEQSGKTVEELALLKSTTSAELLNLNVVLDELDIKSRLIDEFTSKPDDSGAVDSLPAVPLNAPIEVAPGSNTGIVSSARQSVDNQDIISLEREIVVYAESLRVSESELHRANIALEEGKTTYQTNLFALLAEKEALGSENAVLTIRNQEQEKLILKLQDELRKKNNLKSTPQKGIVELLTSNQGLKVKVDKYQFVESSLQEKLAVLENELLLKEDELSSLSKKSNSSNKKQTLLVQNLRTTIEQKENLIDAYQAKIEKLQTSNRNFHKDSIELRRTETKLQDELIQLRTRLAATRDELDSAKEQTKATALPLLGAQEKVSELSGLNKSLSNDIKEQAILIQSLQTTIEEKNLLISSVQEKVKQLQIFNQGYQGELVDFRQNEMKLQDELGQLKTKLTAKQNELGSAKEQASSIQNLQAVLKQKELLISSDQEQIEKFQDELKQLKAELIAKQNELDSAKDQSSTVAVSSKEQIAALEQQLKESVDKIATFEGELSIARTGLTESTENNATLSSELGLVKVALEAEIAKLSQAEKTQQALTTELESVKLALVQSEEKAGNLNSQYEELDLKLKTVEASLQKTVAENVQAVEETEKTGKNIQSLTATITEKESAIQNLTTQLAERTNELNDLKSGIEKASILQADESNKVVDQANKIAALVAKIENAEALSGQQMTELKTTEERLAILNKEKEELVIQLQNALQANADLTEQSDAVKQQLAGLEEKATMVATLAGTINSLEDERDKLLLYTVDTDGDGVSDAIDKCADTEQAIPVNKEGCEEDADNDGVVNRFDLCSDTTAGAETDNAGCSAEQSVIVLSGITFQFGTDKLTEKARITLNKAATILKKNPAINMEVAGHTDSIGDVKANQWLSTSRAKAVLDYLVASGVGDERLQAKGYGSTEPVADNSTDEGRAENRRVELRRIQ